MKLHFANTIESKIWYFGRGGTIEKRCEKNNKIKLSPKNKKI